MKDITIDYALRATWQAVARMYNEEAKKFGATMAVGFTLLSIDPKTGTPSTSLGPKMGMEATSLSRILKSMEEKGLIEIGHERQFSPAGLDQSVTAAAVVASIDPFQGSVVR